LVIRREKIKQIQTHKNSY